MLPHTSKYYSFNVIRTIIYLLFLVICILATCGARQNRQMHVACNNVFRRLMGYHKFRSASGMLVENRLDNFD